MVTEAVWEQVSALPFSDRLDLAERILAGVPEVPDDELMSCTISDFRGLLDAREADMLKHPEDTVPVDQAVASLRARFGL